MGFRVSTAEVEGFLSSHPAVNEAAVVGIPDDTTGEALIAFVSASDVSAKELNRFCLSLPNHKIPSKIIMVDSIPKTNSGKVNKRLLGGKII